ncbi:GNAT family N-acetyltransferase [Pedobacter sp. SD-b]|uniref:GNAT family N-acetyltransferase n=1 Tax=Pedobacter segetis TaxID=2793069 RepID=A0ABS1BIH3_9SPHI|nr:GNAT family N-acetyltransferase [Pedobacter segetis]MBK0382650.1 GNAT family N-acetyltransferase [Pedobacter segetis]
MAHLLDNPIYNALISNHTQFSGAIEGPMFYQRDIAAFAGMQTYDERSFAKLYQQLPEFFVLFHPAELNIPQQFKLTRKLEMRQFVYDHSFLPKGDDLPIVDLKQDDVPKMIELVNLTQPGPFLINTIALGNYTGIFKDDKLVAMAGHRFHPFNYVEVSAVCCHPDHLGKGYAHAIIREQIKRILASGNIPFLHVKKDNYGAIKLYEKLGFKERTKMNAYVIEKI